jgi:hypothetical protein
MVVPRHTNYGVELFKPCFDKASIDSEETRTTCFLLLAWELFFFDPRTREDIELSFHATQILQKQIFNVIPGENVRTMTREPDVACRRSKITKFHLMNYIVGIVLKFRCMRNADSGPSERHHKDLFKYHYDRTQKRSNKFSSQIADGEYEPLLVDKAALHIECFVPRTSTNRRLCPSKDKHSDPTLMMMTIPFMIRAKYRKRILGGEVNIDCP